MYDSPIDKIIGEMQSQMVKNEEGQLMVQMSQTIGYDIDKDELIKALKYDRQQYEKGYEDGLKASRWIPCKERLPEERGYYLVTILSENGYHRSREVIYFGDECQWATTRNVIAWMPLQEPWKEGDK